MIRTGIFIFSIICLLSCASFAATIRVDPDGTGDAISIEGGIEQASMFDTVLVAPAAYYESMIYIWMPIHLISESGPESTIIHHTGDSGEVIFVMFFGDYGEGSIIGFSIEGGVGGITLYNSSMLVMNNIIQDNWSTSGGGGIMLWNAGVSRIINNLIISNGGLAGGGILVVNCSPIIMNNTIVHNTASTYGAAIYVTGNGSIPAIKYNLAYYNDAPLSCCGGIECSGESNVSAFECNNSWNNLPAGFDYCGIVSDRVGVDGNISEDPLFCGEHGSRNFYLQQGSPCAESNVPAFCNNVRIGCYPAICVTATGESSWGRIKTIIKPIK